MLLKTVTVQACAAEPACPASPSLGTIESLQLPCASVVTVRSNGWAVPDGGV